MLCQATWLPIKAKPRRWLVLASRVIGLSLWRSGFHRMQIDWPGGEGRPGTCLLNVNGFYGERWSSSVAPTTLKGSPLQCWRRSANTGLWPSPAHLHNTFASARVVINHCVISLQPLWKWDIIKKKTETGLGGSAAQLLTVIMAPAQRAASRNWWNSTNTDVLQTNMAVNCSDI